MQSSEMSEMEKKCVIYQLLALMLIIASKCSKNILLLWVFHNGKARINEKRVKSTCCQNDPTTLFEQKFKQDDIAKA